MINILHLNFFKHDLTISIYRCSPTKLKLGPLVTKTKKLLMSIGLIPLYYLMTLLFFGNKADSVHNIDIILHKFIFLIVINAYLFESMLFSQKKQSQKTPWISCAILKFKKQRGFLQVIGKIGSFANLIGLSSQPANEAFYCMLTCILYHSEWVALRCFTCFYLSSVVK